MNAIGHFIQDRLMEAIHKWERQRERDRHAFAAEFEPWLQEALKKLPYDGWRQEWRGLCARFSAQGINVTPASAADVEAWLASWEEEFRREDRALQSQFSEPRRKSAFGTTRGPHNQFLMQAAESTNGDPQPARAADIQVAPVEGSENAPQFPKSDASDDLGMIWWEDPITGARSTGAHEGWIRVTPLDPLELAEEIEKVPWQEKPAKILALKGRIAEWILHEFALIGSKVVKKLPLDEQEKRLVIALLRWVIQQDEGPILEEIRRLLLQLVGQHVPEDMRPLAEKILEAIGSPNFGTLADVVAELHPDLKQVTSELTELVEAAEQRDLVGAARAAIKLIRAILKSRWVKKPDPEVQKALDQLLAALDQLDLAFQDVQQLRDAKLNDPRQVKAALDIVLRRLNEVEKSLQQLDPALVKEFRQQVLLPLNQLQQDDRVWMLIAVGLAALFAVVKEGRDPDEPDPNWRSTQTNDTKVNAKILRRNLGLKDGDLREAHHIVASTHRRAQSARDLLDAYQIDINSAENGVALVGGKGAGREIDPRHHRGGQLHSLAGIEVVNLRIDEAIRGISLKEWEKARAAILLELDRIRSLILSGQFP